METAWGNAAGGGAVEGAFLGAQVGMQVLLGGGDVLVPEPQRDDANVVAGGAHVHGPGVPEDVRGDFLVGQRRAGVRGGLLVLAEPGLAAVAGERPRGTAAGGEQRSVGRAGVCLLPEFHYGCGGGGGRGAAFAAALARAPDVRAGRLRAGG